MAVYQATQELIADEGCETTEGPLWHEDLQALFWLDIPAGRLYRYDPALGRHRLALQAVQIGGYTIQADGALLLFGERGRIWTWNPSTGATRIVVEEIPAERGSRFNDVIADPGGRVFAGTMPDGDRPGRLYRLDLRWYLEHFFDYPHDPEIGHAEHVLDALKSWGTQAFNALFDRRDAAIWLDSSILQVRSDDRTSSPGLGGALRPTSRLPRP